MSSFSLSENHSSNSNHKKSNLEEHGTKTMCQTTASSRLREIIRSPSMTTSNDDGDSSYQGTITSNSSSYHHALKHEENGSDDMKMNTRALDDSKSKIQETIPDDGDVHYYEGNNDDSDCNDLKDGNGLKSNNRRGHHRHHRSLSGLFSVNANISGTDASNTNEKSPLSSTAPTTEPRGGREEESQTNHGFRSDKTYPSQQLRSSSSLSSSTAASGTTSGKKHRRIYSGGVSNPAMAHRRINSRGSAAFVDRNPMNDNIRSSEMGTTKGTAGYTGIGNELNEGITHPYQSYKFAYPQRHHQHQQLYHVNERSARSLSPKASPKVYPSRDVMQGHHRDDSEINKYYSQRPHQASSSQYQSNIKAHVMHRMGSGKSKKDGGGGFVGGDDQIAGAHWLQHFRKSPPIDTSMEFVDSVSSHRPQTDQYSTSSRHSYPPSSKQFKKYGENNNTTGSRSLSSHSASPLQSFYGNTEGTSTDFTYSPFQFGGEKGTNNRMFRQSPTASSISSPGYHPLLNPQQQQHSESYPVQQSNRDSRRNSHDRSISQYYPPPPPNNNGYGHYPPPRDAHPMRSPSSALSNFPGQNQNHSPHYHQQPQPQPNQQYYSRSTFIAATHAARDAALGLPPHPLAMEGGQAPSRHQPSYSIESRIETDEPLFAQQGQKFPSSTSAMPKGESTRDTSSFPPNQISSQEPHYRISPQLFQESLNEYLHDGGEETSPASLQSSTELMSSLVGRNFPPSSKQGQNRHDKKDNTEKTHHHRNSSMALLSSLVNEVEKSQPQPPKSHLRTNSTGTLVLDDNLFGEQFPDGESIQPNVSEDIIQPAQGPNFESPRDPEPVLKTTRFSERTKQKQLVSEPNDDEQVVQPTVPSTGRKVTGAVSKRVRRKCKIEGCTNRVVQGGLCISHGAKRKKCAYPGCTKHVKKAGMCSTHGPARKRCEVEGCPKVAVQGGRCIAHGAKKKMCKVDDCQKQAILGGMCKKHHDMDKAGKLPPAPSNDEDNYCQPVGNQSFMFTKENKVNFPDVDEANQNRPTAATSNKISHRRGLSIFQDMNTVDTIIGCASDSANAASTDQNPRDGSTRRNSHNRGLSIFAEEEVVDKIVQGDV